MFRTAEQQSREDHKKGMAVSASITTALINPLELVGFFTQILTQVLTQFLATLCSSWLFILPPRTLAQAHVSEILPISLLSLTFFWLGGRALNII